MLVKEIFKSCQGEGPGARLPTLFVRLAGCNLAVAGTPCSWCDTPYSQASKGRSMSTSAIIARLGELSEGCNRVCITGGEPLYQISELRELVGKLKGLGSFVEIFTNGTMFPPLQFVHAVDSWIVDIKCPASGVSNMCRTTAWLGAARPTDAVKFVVNDGIDMAYVLRTLQSRSTRASVYVSPCITADIFDGESHNPGARLWLQDVWKFCVKNNFVYGLQIHRVVFGNKRGV